MENCVKVAMAANRRTVQEGLNRRRLENELDAFEVAMIRRCNDNCANAVLQRKMDETVRLVTKGCDARIDARAEVKAKAKQKRKDTALGCLSFFAYAVLLLWLTGWTHLPMWGAALYVVCGALFLFLRMCEIHGLLQREGEK